MAISSPTCWARTMNLLSSSDGGLSSMVMNVEPPRILRRLFGVSGSSGRSRGSDFSRKRAKSVSTCLLLNPVSYWEGVRCSGSWLQALIP